MISSETLLNQDTTVIKMTADNNPNQRQTPERTPSESRTCKVSLGRVSASVDVTSIAKV